MEQLIGAKLVGIISSCAAEKFRNVPNIFQEYFRFLWVLVNLEGKYNFFN